MTCHSLRELDQSEILRQLNRRISPTEQAVAPSYDARFVNSTARDDYAFNNLAASSAVSEEQQLGLVILRKRDIAGGLRFEYWLPGDGVSKQIVLQTLQYHLGPSAIVRP